VVQPTQNETTISPEVKEVEAQPNVTEVTE
jgi:hypothetical protein